MADPRVARLAHLLTHYCTAVMPGDWVLVRGHLAALPLVDEILRAVTLAGGHTTVQLTDDAQSERFATLANDDQLAWVSPVEQLLAEKVNARIVINAPANTRALAGLTPEQAQKYQQGQRAFGETLMRRGADGSLRGVLTNFPCAALAQEAGMGLHEYEDFLYAATACDSEDPVAYWRSVHDRQQRLVEWLRGRSQVVVRGPSVDLTLSIAGRSFMNSDGKRNMPSGEIFTGPVEDSVNGWIRFDYPAIFGGRAVEGVELRFVDGAVVEARADKEEEFLRRTLDSDPGARFLGEFAVGTNDRIQRFTRSILFDEKIGGTLHVAVGAGYPETGSRNRSRVHWDFICDMRQSSEILVDGELFYRNGRFLLEEPDTVAPASG
ncbi:MAG: aminopeptidase [Caldilineaceae bacterium]